MKRIARCAVYTAIATTLGFSLIASSHAQYVVSANDNKVTLENGVVKVSSNVIPDTVSLISLNSKIPKLVAEINVPASVAGPASSVAVRWDERYALVTGGTKMDPDNAGKTISDNKLTLLDLGVTPPVIAGQVEAGAGASGVAISPNGGLVAVANRGEGTVSIFTLKGKDLTKINTIKLGDEKSSPAAPVFTPDGRYVLVTRDGDSFISLLSVNGEKVEATGRHITAGVRPSSIAIHPNGKLAIVANYGRNAGDTDTISVIDLISFTTVETYNVGRAPESIAISPDGKLLSVVLQNGSNKPLDFMFYNSQGKLLVFKIEGMKLKKFGEAKIGGWPQGIAFGNDSKTILVQNMVEQELQVLRIEKNKVKDTGQRIKVKGGPAGIGVAQKPM